MVFFILDESMFDPDDENPPPSWTPPQESSLEDTRVRPAAKQLPVFSEITYQLVQEGTIREKTKLVTNTGYSYNIRKRGPNGTIDWQCTVRRKDFRCKASVIQQDGKFFWRTTSPQPSRCHWRLHCGRNYSSREADRTRGDLQTNFCYCQWGNYTIICFPGSFAVLVSFGINFVYDVCKMGLKDQRDYGVLVTFTVLPRQTYLYEFNLFYMRSREIPWIYLRD